MTINPRKAWVGNIPHWYKVHDVRRAVNDAGFGTPSHVNLEWGPNDSQYAVLTFRSIEQAQYMVQAGQRRSAMFWEDGWHAVIR